MAKSLDAQVSGWRNRPLDAGPYTFVWLDALVLKVREGGRTVPVHALVATGVNGDGVKEVLGLEIATAEDGAGWLALPARTRRTWTDRGHAGHLRRPRRPGFRGRLDPARRGLAAVPNALRGEPDDQTPKCAWRMGEGDAALDLRPARRRRRARPVRPGPRRPGRQAARRGRAPRPGPRRRARLHRVPQGDLATDLVQQPARTAEPGDPPPHRRGRHLPRP